MATYNGDPECVKLLLEAGAKVNQPDNDGKTPLFGAARYGDEHRIVWQTQAEENSSEVAHLANLQCVKLLLEAGADVNHTTRFGQTPLLMAANEANPECVKMLLEAGAKVNCSDEWRGTPLKSAALRANQECIKLLLEAGADVNHIDSAGQTPLTLVTYSANPGCVKLMLEAGADVNHADKKNQTALLQAEKCGDAQSVKMLLDAGADVNQAHLFWIASLLFLNSHKWHRYAAEAITKLLLAAGIHVNVVFPESRLAERYKQCVQKAMPLLLYAAGEEPVDEKQGEAVDGATDAAENQEDLIHTEDGQNLDLKNECRKVIRQHLLTLDRHTNLFQRIPELEMTNERPGIPDYLVSYLLYGQNLEVDWDEYNKLWDGWKEYQKRNVRRHRGCPCWKRGLMPSRGYRLAKPDEEPKEDQEEEGGKKEQKQRVGFRGRKLRLKLMKGDEERKKKKNEEEREVKTEEKKMQHMEVDEKQKSDEDPTEERDQDMPEDQGANGKNEVEQDQETQTEKMQTEALQQGNVNQVDTEKQDMKENLANESEQAMAEYLEIEYEKELTEDQQKGKAQEMTEEEENELDLAESKEKTEEQGMEHDPGKPE